MSSARSLIAALIINAALGILYVWSLFIAPLEIALSTQRSVLSVAPALALVFFTIGMVVHDSILRRLPPWGFALLVFLCAGGGHLLFGLWPSLVSLMLGYGLLFGFGAGLGYGLALALATSQPPSFRGLAVGLTVAAFAVGGIVLAAILPTLTPDDVAYGFRWMGIGLGATGVLVAGLLTPQARFRPAAAASTPDARVALLSPAFLKLGAAFFILCYLGLMVVSHEAGILAEAGVMPDLLYLGPVMLNVGYVGGSLLGGKVAQTLPGRWSLAGANALAALALVLLIIAPSLGLALAGTAVIGLVFGGSASLMPVLIGEQYGIDRIGAVYGKLMIAYGLAGLTAPSLTAELFIAGGAYRLPLVIGLLLAGLGIMVAASFKPIRSAA